MGDGQAETGARLVADIRAAVEPIKKVGLLVLRNAGALIPDAENHVGRLMAEADVDPRAGRRVFAGIGKQVAEDVVQQGFVHQGVAQRV